MPSRMNVGQVLEYHLGYAAKKLGEQIERLARERELAEARAKLQKIYSREEYERLTAGLDDDALLDKLRKYGRGIHVATPVFDGASEVEIRKLLVEAGVDEVGQATLYDGLTGEPFANQVTVGTMYMLKLHHLVANKIHARSTGPYFGDIAARSVVTYRQTTDGRACLISPSYFGSEQAVHTDLYLTRKIRGGVFFGYDIDPSRLFCLFRFVSYSYS